MTDSKVLTAHEEVHGLATNRRPPEVEWVFVAEASNNEVTLKNEGLTAVLNEVGSYFCAGAVSSEYLKRKLHHYIEVEINSQPYSRCGIGLHLHYDSACPTPTDSFPNYDVWELQASGKRFHNRVLKGSSSPWRKGDRVGLHVDRWNGKVEFYLNGICLGPVFEDQASRKALQEGESLLFFVYSDSPPVTFTLRTALSFPSTLQLQCLLVLRPTLKPRCRQTPVYKALAVDKKNKVPPGILRVIMRKWWWVSLQKKKQQTPTRSSPRLAEKREKARVLMRHTFPKLSYASVTSTLSL